jgi:hypothetical protein
LYSFENPEVPDMVLAWRQIVALRGAMSTIYRVPGDPMRLTLALGQRVAVDDDAYHTALPEVGDVVVFYAPLNIEPA